MTDIETVEVTVKIPAQEYKFTYEKYYYDIAMEGLWLDHLMDADLNNIDPDIDIYGPNGDLINAY